MDFHGVAVSDYRTRDAVAVTEVTVDTPINYLGYCSTGSVFGDCPPKTNLAVASAFRGRPPGVFAASYLLQICHPKMIRMIRWATEEVDRTVGLRQNSCRCHCRSGERSRGQIKADHTPHTRAFPEESRSVVLKRERTPWRMTRILAGKCTPGSF